ncbi:MAG: hypothetical protein IT372_35900, partial [Polyangiaceae bacterium]|nr:hypothetical protein [Polyangiaceae bacterium]
MTHSKNPRGPRPARPPAEKPARPAPRPSADAPRREALLGTPDVRDLDELEAPPIAGKAHPSADLHAAVPTLDDDARDYHHHPNESGAVEFEVNPYSDDAAADLAGDLGSEFIEGATRGQDMSDVVMSRDEAESELPFLVETEAEPPPEREEAAEEGNRAARPRSRAKRTAPPPRAGSRPVPPRAGSRP